MPTSKMCFYNVVNHYIRFDWILLFSSCFQLLLGFNLDAKFPRFYQGPSQSRDFGYSVDYYAGTEGSWITVGAPKTGFNGSIFKCQVSINPTNTNNCELINIGISASPDEGQMLGSTVSLGVGKELVSCAPKYSYTHSDDDNLPVGACYYIENFLEENPPSFAHMPCKIQPGAKPDGEEYGFCQLGISATFVKDKTELIVGAAGSFYNQGSIFLFNKPLSQISPTLPLHTAEHKPEVPDGWDAIDYYRQTYDNNYLGYTVAGGKTIESGAILAASAPRRLGSNLLGAVVVYSNTLNRVYAEFYGKQLGEYFGHGLAFVDINGDGLDDLVVGSPLYTDIAYKQPEVGRIYIYYQKTESGRVVFTTPPTKINGNVSLARFGNTITSLGDVNADGYQDFLVSAPYESNDTVDGNIERFGALYLFNGGPDGVIAHPTQVIRGSNLEQISSSTDTIRGLGFSSQGGVDLDGNGYPDVVAGAYLSNQAVVIMSRPVVNLTSVSTITPTKVDLESLTCNILNSNVKSACFSVFSCFSYSGKQVPPSIDFFYSYDVDATYNDDDKRTYLLDTSSRSMTLNAGKKQCVTEVVYVKRDIKDKLQPIAVKISYWLKNRNEPVEPVLDYLTGSSSTAVADIDKHCGDDNICVPELQVVSKISPDVIYVSSYSEVVIESTVLNEKENAYQTQLVVKLPSKAFYIKVLETTRSPVHCNEVNMTVACQVANPLKTNEQVRVKVLFGIHNLKDEVQLKFDVLANCSNQESFQTSVVHLTTKVDEKASVRIQNVSLPEIIALDKIPEELKNTSYSIPVSHTYEIINEGPSTIGSARISLLWPLTLTNGQLLLGLDEVVTSDMVKCSAVHVVNNTKILRQLLPPLTALVKNDDQSKVANYYDCRSPHNCSEIICDVQQFPPSGDHVLITLNGRLQVRPLVSSNIDSVITSSLVFDVTRYAYRENVGSDVYPAEVHTFALYPPTTSYQPVEWWIIACAVGGGVIFLLLIVLLLWRCGFFKRNKVDRSNAADDDRDLQEPLHQAGENEGLK